MKRKKRKTLKQLLKPGMSFPTPGGGKLVIEKDRTEEYDKEGTLRVIIGRLPGGF